MSDTEFRADDAGRAAPSLLIVDDDAVFRERLARALQLRGYEVRSAPDGITALDLARRESPEYAVVDLRMPGPSGLEVVRGLVEIDPATRVVVLTGYGSISTAVEAMRLGAFHYLPKPADADDILAALRRDEPGRGSAQERPGEDLPSAPSLARAEWEHIHRVLGDCEGNISEAARRLGIHRRSLQRKLHKLAPD